MNRRPGLVLGISAAVVVTLHGVIRFGRPLTLALALTGAFVVVGGGCRDATQVTVIVSAAARCSELTSGVSIAVAASPQSSEHNIAAHFPSAATRTCEPDGTIGTLVVTPSGDSAAVVVVAGFGGQDTATCTPDNGYKSCIVARRSFAFIEHRSLTLPIRLSPDCVGVPCDVLSTCSKGACVPSKVDCTNDACPDLDEDGKTDGGSPLDGAAVDGPHDGALDGTDAADAGVLPSDPLCDAAPFSAPMAVQDFRLSRGLPRYCVDRTEVTQQQYASLLVARPPKTLGCAKPVLDPGSDFTGGKNCTEISFMPQTRGDSPVVCVDKCDADTYCNSVGKRLCSGDEWSVACQSGNEANDWTFGGAPFQPAACNGMAFGAGQPVAVASLPACINRGAPSSETRVFDMTGNVWEWVKEGSWTTQSGRGGGFKAGQNELGCRFVVEATVSPLPEYSNEIGFRCCKPAP